MKNGFEYLQKVGLNLIIWTEIIGIKNKLVFQPGSLLEDKEKETLPIPYLLKESLRKFGQPKMTSEFMRRYNITTIIDMRRLVRICSILLTNFIGPEEEDDYQNHLNRLKNYCKGKPLKGLNSDFFNAFRTLDKILGFEKPLATTDYSCATDLLIHIYKLID